MDRSSTSLLFCRIYRKAKDLPTRRAPDRTAIWKKPDEYKDLIRNIAIRYLLTIMLFLPGNIHRSLQWISRVPILSCVIPERLMKMWCSSPDFPVGRV